MPNTHATALPRRTVLRGAGATMALPLLEAMLPQTTSGITTTAAMPKRLGLFYFGTGMNMREFEPQNEGRNYTVSPTLKVVEKHRDDFTVVFRNLS